MSSTRGGKRGLESLSGTEEPKKKGGKDLPRFKKNERPNQGNVIQGNSERERRWCVGKVLTGTQTKVKTGDVGRAERAHRSENKLVMVEKGGVEKRKGTWNKIFSHGDKGGKCGKKEQEVIWYKWKA